jgi:glycogen debranching enzyme
MRNNLICFLAIILSLTLISFLTNAQDQSSLLIKSNKKVGQIEVGGPFVGIEIHNSFPLLNRISFYYPVANSIDISDDYWKRENYRIMSVGLKVGDEEKRLLKKQIYRVSQTPYSVLFEGDDFKSNIRIKYEFCKNEPAMVITYEILNTTKQKNDYEVYTKLESILRTCHTYSIVDKAYTEYDKDGSIIRVNYPFVSTGNSQVFVINSGEQPSSYTSKEILTKKFKNLDDWWLNTNAPLPEEIISANDLSKPAIAFIYKKALLPNESIKIVQIVGSSLISEAKEKTKSLRLDYKKEVDEYKEYILNEALKKDPIITGNKNLDFTTKWSKAVLATNAHYLNGQIVPMPAQAEYNFYFTHDALLTDLAAINFDKERVKRDLKFILSLADSDKTIPHAYYWKDSTYTTEFAGSDNWNHFWFTLVCARYLRHTADTEFLNKLYPYIKRSIQLALKNKGKDDLIWSVQPDWWDIGNNFGPRAYMSILAIRALREYNYVSALLNVEDSELKSNEKLADRINTELVEKLWDKKLKYLISYFADGKEDEHIYMGSLLASHFNLLDKKMNLELLRTAKKNLLDPKLGIYTLYPMDLHLLGDYMGFVGNEAGDPYYYANGGIWPHGNAWYALSLISNGLNEEAYNFVQKTMTLNGIINSPNGQPALYEYRISDKTNPLVYGKVDKPQFLWAGGWYLYTLYNLFGLKENEWNISFDPYNPQSIGTVNLSLLIKGKSINVKFSGRGNEIAFIKYNDRVIPTVVIPADMNNLNSIDIKLGKMSSPIIYSANGILTNVNYNEKNNTMEFDLESFEGHLIEIKILSPTINKDMSLNGNIINSGISITKKNDVYDISLKHLSSSKKNHYSIKFE